MACRPATARQAPPSRRARAQRQGWQQISFGDFLLTTCATGFWRTLPSQPRADLCGHLKSPPLVVSAACPNEVILSGQFPGNSFCPENEKRLKEIIRARAGPDNFPALGVFRALGHSAILTRIAALIDKLATEMPRNNDIREARRLVDSQAAQPKPPRQRMSRSGFACRFKEKPRSARGSCHTLTCTVTDIRSHAWSRCGLCTYCRVSSGRERRTIHSAGQSLQHMIQE